MKTEPYRCEANLDWGSPSRVGFDALIETIFPEYF